MFFCVDCHCERTRPCEACGHQIRVRDRPTWWIKYYQNGRAVRESTGTTKETVARRILRSREGDVEHGIPITPNIGRISVEDAAQDVINDYHANGRRSISELKRRISKHLLAFFRGRRLASITTPDVRAYITKRLADEIGTDKGSSGKCETSRMQKSTAN
jgi:hypothetical protein